MKLAYRAYDRSGRQVAETIEAADTASATEVLRRRGFYVTEIAESGGSAPSLRGKAPGRLGRTRRLKELVVFTRQIYVLISSGTAQVDGLAALGRQAKNAHWREVIADIRSRIEEGASLSEAMATHPEYFDPVYRNLVAAGESSGNLLAILDRLSVLTRKQLHVRNSIVGAMIYPCLLTTISLGVLTILLTFVVPRFADLFKSLDVVLPPTTQFLLSISNLLRNYWWALIAVVAAGITGTKHWLATDSGRRAYYSALLRIPQLGQIMRSFAAARITRLLGILLDSHVPILDALKLTRHATKNVLYTELIAKAEDNVTKGEPISSAFADGDLIAPSIHEAIRNGEHSGQLGRLLLDISGFLDEENDVVLRSLTSIIEPVILIVLGVLVGFVALSMFMPLFDLTAMAGGGGM